MKEAVEGDLFARLRWVFWKWRGDSQQGDQLGMELLNQRLILGTHWAQRLPREIRTVGGDM